jgi:hypothetical protein
MLSALLSKQASHHLELPGSSESLSRMFGRHWRVIGDRVEIVPLAALRHMMQLRLLRQSPTQHEPWSSVDRQLELPFSGYAARRLVNLVRPKRCFRGGSPTGPSLSGSLACNSSSQRRAKRNQNSRSALLAALSDWERHCLICSRRNRSFQCGFKCRSSAEHPAGVSFVLWGKPLLVRSCKPTNGIASANKDARKTRVRCGSNHIAAARRKAPVGQ